MTYIREATCSKFNLEQLKTAREVLYTTCEPETHYGYRGPQGKNNPERERMNDAFEGIFKKLVKLDAENKMPSFSVPSDELMSVLVTNVGEHTTCERRFQRLGGELEELKKTFHSFVAVVTSNNPLPVSAIPPVTRDRLLSTGSTKRNAGEMSEEESDQSPSDLEAELDAGFVYQRNQRQRYVKKVKLNNEKSREVKQDTYSDKARMKPRSKPPSTWGTAKPTSSLKGAVSDIFLYNCDADVTTKDVVDHFKAHSVTIKKIEQRSHELATRTSFRLSPATKDDYEKIIQADLLPEQVAVRRYIPPKWDPSVKNPRTGRNQFKPADEISHAERLEQLDQIGSLRESKNEAPMQSTSSATPGDSSG